ncbi:MAG: ATP synthase F1 subunit delta [Lactobacillus sp.]|nr:ATP synthase F1 subunit delta [Lactobacillus sp.]
MCWIASSVNFRPRCKAFYGCCSNIKRFDAVIEILNNFNTHYDRLKKIAHGKAISAVKLSDEQLQKVSQAYADKYGLNELRLTNEIKPEILGGLILQVGDRRIDGSIQTKLERIRTQLTAK